MSQDSETTRDLLLDCAERLEREGRLGDLRALLGAIVLPLADTIERAPYGTHYVRFLAHLFADRQRRDRLLSHNREAAPLRRIYRLMRGLSPDLPEAVWAERLRLVLGGNINALADRERMRESSDPRWRALPTAAFVSNLIDSGLAVLTAPASPATLKQMGRGARARDREEENRYGTDG